MKKFNYLKEKIETELKNIIPDLTVSIYENQTLTSQNFKHCGENAYPGMVEGIIRVHWDRFFDRIAGNGWMYANDWLFKFDLKDGSCKYEGYPENVEIAVNKFIDKIKNEN